MSWPESGSQRSSKSVVFHNGNLDQQHSFRTGFVVLQNLLEFYNNSAFNPQPKVRKQYKTKDEFYVSLPEQDINILLGNSKVNRFCIK